MDLAGLAGYCGGSFAFGFVSGLVPAANTEAYLLAIAALAPREVLPAAVVAVTGGQMLAKACIYLAGQGACSGRRLGRHAHKLVALGGRLAGAQAQASSLVFSSALVGIPPFYAVSLAAGSLRYPLKRFLLVGASGRLIRFAAVVVVPHLLRSAS